MYERERRTGAQSHVTLSLNSSLISNCNHKSNLSHWCQPKANRETYDKMMQWASNFLKVSERRLV